MSEQSAAWTTTIRRTLQRLLAVAILAASIVPFAAKPAWACLCAPFTKTELGQRADAVFTGTVARVTDESGKDVRLRIVNFDVDVVYKGEPNPSIDIQTGFGGGDCGYPFVVDRRYTVFAFNERSGSLYAGRCNKPVDGDIDPVAYGLGPGTTGFQEPVTGLHRPLSLWLILFTLVVAAITVTAMIMLARRRRAASALRQAK
jgi:hypothetical protein